MTPTESTSAQSSKSSDAPHVGIAASTAAHVGRLSHYWAGIGGMLELSERLQTGGNKFSGWGKANERERAMLTPPGTRRSPSPPANTWTA